MAPSTWSRSLSDFSFLTGGVSATALAVLASERAAFFIRLPNFSLNNASISFSGRDFLLRDSGGEGGSCFGAGTGGGAVAAAVTCRFSSS